MRDTLVRQDDEPMTPERPPRDPTIADGASSPWSATETFGGLSVLAITVTLCLLVLHWAGVL